MFEILLNPQHKVTFRQNFTIGWHMFRGLLRHPIHVDNGANPDHLRKFWSYAL